MVHGGRVMAVVDADHNSHKPQTRARARTMRTLRSLPQALAWAPPRRLLAGAQHQFHWQALLLVLTGGVRDLREGDVLDLQARHGDDVLAEVPGDGAAAVLDVEGAAIRLVGRRGARVELGMQAAGGAVRRGDPQVGGARVEDDLEGLAGRADLDGAVVLRVLHRRDGDVARTAQLAVERAQHAALLEHAGAAALHSQGLLQHGHLQR